jgi:Domain of unknown function (DUF4252)
MRSITKQLTGVFALLMFVLIVPAIGQDHPARLNFENLAGLEAKARDVVEVNVDGKLIELAKRVTAKVNDPDAQKVSDAIAGLKAVYVRVYNFEKENEYNVADVDEVRAQLSAPGWERLANVRSKRNNQKVDVFTMFTGNVMSGVAVVVSDAKSVALVNVIGPIDIEALVDLSGRMNIPKIEIESDKPMPRIKNQ